MKNIFTVVKRWFIKDDKSNTALIFPSDLFDKCEKDKWYNFNSVFCRGEDGNMYIQEMSMVQSENNK